MRRARPKTGGGIGILVSVLAVSCSQSVDLEAVAPRAAEANKSAFPKATLTKVSEESEGGLRAYEATLMQDHRRTEVLVTADGAFLEIETQVSIEDVPAPAAEAINKLVGDGKITMLERVDVVGKVKGGAVTPVDPPTVFYEVKYRRGGLPHESQVGPDGAPVDD